MKDEIKDLKCLSALGNLQSFAIDGTKGSKIVDINVNIVKNHITNLQQKVDQYENPDDMTLIFMWCDEKAKDKIKQLQEEIERQSKAQVILDNQISEMYCYKSRNEKAIEYINSRINTLNIISYEDIINILQGSDKE